MRRYSKPFIISITDFYFHEHYSENFPQFVEAIFWQTGEPRPIFTSEKLLLLICCPINKLSAKCSSRCFLSLTLSSLLAFWNVLLASNPKWAKIFHEIAKKFRLNISCVFFVLLWMMIIQEKQSSPSANVSPLFYITVDFSLQIQRIQTMWMLFAILKANSTARKQAAWSRPCLASHDNLSVLPQTHSHTRQLSSSAPGGCDT